jgi:hypothetical protein
MGLEILYMYAQSNFKEDFFEFGQNKFFIKLLRPFVSVNSNCLKFLLF